ncbi:hypothetical protein [Enterovirga sp.]|uniref:hypothetical protein n=1 Tax=Enterovirga sp. TaxID=2026350 RepID=UPI002CDB8F3D|nr:hypothetical protein [Enterovirga sp.]HMO30120.1 hypothetical protein [Enterovirga sp.]
MRISAIGLMVGLGLAAHAWAQGQPAAEPQQQGAFTPADVQALLEAARETAKATRESVDYVRVTPDLLSQILAKLDKLEDKLDKVENAIKAQKGRR